MTELRANLTPHAREALALSPMKAQRSGNNYIGPEHLFLTILAIPEAGAVKVLKKLGLEIESVRDQVEKRTAPGKVQGLGQGFWITPDSCPSAVTAKKIKNEAGAWPESR